MSIVANIISPITNWLRQSGGESPFDPSTILDNWWDADDISGSDGDNVSLWTDKIGSAIMQQETSGLQPTLQTDELNGHNTVRFDNVDDKIESVPIQTPEISNWAGSVATWAFIFKASPDSGRLMGVGVDVGTFWYSSSGKITMFTDWTTDGTYGEATPVVPYDTWHYAVITWDGSSAGNVPVIRVDGIALDITTYSLTAGSHADQTGKYVALGNNSSDSGAQERPLNGDIQSAGFKAAIWTEEQISSWETWAAERIGA